MYHFFRRFFIFILVLAFGFSFLLCAFVHTQMSQPWRQTTYDPTVYLYPFSESYKKDAGTQVAPMRPQVAPIPVPMFTTTLVSHEQMNKLLESLHVGYIHESVPMYLSTFGQFNFGGSTSSIIDRVGMQLGTTMQYSPINLGSQSYSTGSYDTPGYGFPLSSHGMSNYAGPSFYPASGSYYGYSMQIPPSPTSTSYSIWLSLSDYYW